MRPLSLLPRGDRILSAAFGQPPSPRRRAVPEPRRVPLPSPPPVTATPGARGSLSRRGGERISTSPSGAVTCATTRPVTGEPSPPRRVTYTLLGDPGRRASLAPRLFTVSGGRAPSRRKRLARPRPSRGRSSRRRGITFTTRVDRLWLPDGPRSPRRGASPSP